MRAIGSGLGMSGPDEEGVTAPNPFALRSGEPGTRHGRFRRRSSVPGQGAALDVFRAVPVDLAGADAQDVPRLRAAPAVYAHAAPCLRIQHEKPDAGFFLEGVDQRITCWQGGLNRERARGLDLEESLRAVQERNP